MKTLTEICSNGYDTLESLKQLDSELALFRMNGYVLFFRGEADVAYKLKPSIVRNYAYSRDVELRILKEFKYFAQKQGWDKNKFPSVEDNLYYMEMARHLGINSRLLDWTTGIWIAMSFMTHNEEKIEKDGRLWILAVPNREIDNYSDPMQIEDDSIHVFKAPYYGDSISGLPIGNLRRFMQNGAFTSVADKYLDIPLNKFPNLQKSEILLQSILINKEQKKAFGKSQNYKAKSQLVLEKLPDDIEEMVKHLNG